MSKKTLLLSATYEVISFIPEKKVFKHLIKEKVEILSSWDEVIRWGSGSMKYPAILKLKHHVKRNYFNSNFSRQAVVKRDRSCCQYCGVKLPSAQITIDHVLPRAQGGGNTFTNCVVACQACNNKKGDRTPIQAGMPLLKKPTHPSFSNHQSIDSREHWHCDWDDFLINS